MVPQAGHYRKNNTASGVEMIENEDQEAELPLDGVATQLARARRAAGWSVADVAAQTRITERHLELIEAGNFGALPSRAYAIGFVRSYAKALGLDSNAVIAELREELARDEHEHARRPLPAFEPGDPARLPGRRVAWYAAGGLVVVLVAGVLIWPSLYSPGGILPSSLPSPTASAASAVAAAPAAPTGPVVFTATRDKVWVRFVDGAGQQLFQKELALGESWTVPESAAGVTLTTARPDGLAVTLGGRPLPPLATTEQVIRDVPVSAAALLARTAAVTTPAPAPTGEVTGVPAPTRQVRAAGRPAARPSEAPVTPGVPSPGAEPLPLPATAGPSVTEDSQG